MNWDALRVLKQNTENIVNAVSSDLMNDEKISELSERHSTQMNELLISLYYTIQDNNSSSIDHLARIVKRKSISDISEYTSNYNLFKEYLKTAIRKVMIENKIEESVCDMIDNSIEILGESLTSDIQDWGAEWWNRRNIKSFDPTVEIPAYLENRLDIILENVPIQTSGYADFYIKKLKRTDYDMFVRDWLFRNFYYNENLASYKYHEYSLISSSICYLFLPIPQEPSGKHYDPSGFGSLYHNWATKPFHCGVHAGAILSETITQGYDFSFIGCTGENITSSLKKEWSEILSTLTNLNYLETPWCFPIISVHIGKWDGLVSDGHHIGMDGETYIFGRKNPDYPLYEGYIKGNILI